MSSSQYDDDSKKGAWTPEEDEQLKELVALYGPKGWSVIAKDVPGRSGKSCRLRCVRLCFAMLLIYEEIRVAACSTISCVDTSAETCV